jgi:hypothetical protein
MKYRFVVFLGLFFSMQVYAQQKTPIWKKLHPDSLVNLNLKVLPVPVASYSPETGLSVGFNLSYFFNAGDSGAKATTRNSLAGLEFRYTSRKQTTIQANWSIYTNKEQFFINGATGFADFYERFWTLSTPAGDNDQFRELQYYRTYFRNTFAKNLGKQSFLGFALNYNRITNMRLSGDTSIKINNIPGANGSTVFGLGPVLLLDHRDNQFSPSSEAWYAAFNALFYLNALGGQYTFQQYNIDLRQYNVIKATNGLLCFQAVGNFGSGEIPLVEKSRLGSNMIMRGYFQGRFRDNQLLAAQVEYRQPLGRFLVLAAFMSAGQTAPSLSSMRMNNMESAAGGGVRVLLNKAKKIYARIDVGYTRLGNFGFYARLGDAF